MPLKYSSKSSIRFITILTLIVTGIAHAAAPTPRKRPDASALQKVSAGVFKFNEVTLDSGRQTVSFPAAINMTSNLVEYVVVCDDGKTHESLLKTTVEPKDIHVAMLLIGAKGTPPPKASEPDHKKVLKGDRIRVWIEWRDKATRNRVRAEDLVLNDQTKLPMKHGDWIYNGSWIFNGSFVAQTERSVVSIICDRDALMNSGHPQRADDEIWFANTKKIPTLDHPVSVKIELLPQQEQKASSKK